MDGRVADRVLQVVHSQRILTAATQTIVETGRASTRPGQASNRPGQHQTDLGPAGRFSRGQPPPAAPWDGRGMDGMDGMERHGMAGGAVAGCWRDTRREAGLRQSYGACQR